MQDDKIAFIQQHERFPFSTAEKITFAIISVLLIAALILVFVFYNEWLFRIGAIICVPLFIYFVYSGLSSSLAFHPIETVFDEEKNKKIIQMCLAHLNIKAYRDKKETSVFVCFIHNQYSNQREDIYIIAKDQKILINSNKDKDSEESGAGPDFVEKIGLSIYITAKRLNRIQRQE